MQCKQSLAVIQFRSLLESLSLKSFISTKLIPPMFRHCYSTLLLMVSACSSLNAADIADGAKIYSQKCASCHGSSGQGTEDVPHQLFGDRSTFELAEVISNTMPEGEPEECEGEDAKIVAEWMRQEFYSPQAQARINPPRRRLSRLTVSQYRNGVADLVQGFSWFNQPNENSGLESRYYSSRHFRDKSRVIERLDPTVFFDFKDKTPDDDKFAKPEEFSISWQGSLVIDETGWYDFIVQTENGVRLFVNDNDSALIDAWVKSGDDSEFRGSRFLIAGRLYPIRLEWFKFKEPTASIKLLWKPPHGTDQPVPSRHLSPQSTPEVLVVATPFPPDDRSDGYIRGTSVSAEWDQATTYAAIEVVDKLPRFLGNAAKLKKEQTPEEQTNKLQGFCETFAFRAFRRKLTDEQKQIYIQKHFEQAESSSDAVRRSVLAVLKSPRFLYREITGSSDVFTQAERMSFALTDSIPDKDLLTAASKGWMKDEQGLRDQAWRLVNSYRGKVRLHEFLRVWLNLERLHDVDKAPESFPDFTADVASDMRASLEMLLHEAASSEDGFGVLMKEQKVWLNGRLAQFYGVDSVSGDSNRYQKVDFESDRRLGVITHPYLLTALAYRDVTSPIHRGVFVSRGILGRTLKPPPDSVAPTAPDLEPHLTTRERVTTQTSPQMCANCHTMINGLGFPLEEFDAVGRYRDKEKERPIDATGRYRLQDGEFQTFEGAAELSRFLSESPETRRSFSRQLFHHMVQQPILAYGPDSIDQLADFLTQNDDKIKNLMVEIAVHSATLEPFSK